MPKWTPERRQRQREIALKHKPWLSSTGPKTSEGKAISSQNALKHGGRSAQAIALNKRLSELGKLLSEL